jgi:hypothetical protein
MTEQQKNRIEQYQKQFEQNLNEYKSYGSDSICLFEVYVNEVPQDKNITIVSRVITGLDDNTNEPFTSKTDLLIEQNGNVVKLKDMFPNENINDYIKKLKRII